MATDRQIEANRENSKSSTGPRTAEGKAVVAGNAVKHGLTAATRVVIRDESPDEFARMHAALHAETVTGSELERGLIDEVAAAMWRLRRAARIERDMMDEDIRRALWKKRHRARVYDERREEHRVRLVAAGELDPDEQLDPQPFDPLKKEALLGDQIRVRMIEDDGYAKLGRYEVQLRRGLYQAVRELRMLRAQWAKDFRDSSNRPAGAGDEQASEQPVATVQPAATASADRPKADKKVRKDTTEKAAPTSAAPRIAPSPNSDATHEPVPADRSAVRVP